MALPPNIVNLEKQKFGETLTGKVAVRIIGDDVFTFTVSGLTIAGKIQEVPITSTGWTLLPATQLADRNALRIQNRSGILCKLQYVAGSTGAFVGTFLEDGGDAYFDIRTIDIYGRAESGSPSLVVEEIS